MKRCIRMMVPAMLPVLMWPAISVAVATGAAPGGVSVAPGRTPDAAGVATAVAAFRRRHDRVGVRLDHGLVTSLHGRSFSKGATSQDSADAFLNQYAAVFGVARQALAGPQVRSIMRGRFTAFRYEQRWRGLPVDGTYVTLLVREQTDHPLVLVTARTAAVPDDLAQPVLTADQAHAAVAAVEPQLTTFEPARLVVHPRSTPPVLAWFFWAESPPGAGYQRYGFFVDAVTGLVLERRDGIVNADITGVVTGFATPGVLPDEPDNPPVDMPIYGAHVFALNGEDAFVGPAGDYTIPHDGDTPVTVRLNLAGQWSFVQNQADPLNPVTDAQDVMPPGPADFLLNAEPSELVTAQLNAIIHTTTIHDFVKSIIPGFNGVDQQLPALVNVNSDCNASYTFGTPGVLRFFTSQAGNQPHCPNTAYAMVIYHEYGHFIIHQALGFTAAGDYHEGVADAVSGLLVDDPCMADGFGGQGQGCLRNIDVPDFVFPVGHPDPHISGLAIAGAYWDLRSELIERLGHDAGLALARELMYNQILIGPGVIGPDVAIAVLTLDDDDGDIFNGTPDYPAIQDAFSAHGMPGPVLSLLEFSYPQEPPALASPLTDTPILLEITSGTAGTTPDLDSFMLHVSSEGQPFDTVAPVAVDALPDGALVELALPPGVCFGALRWFISAATESGEPVTDPPDAPSATHLTFVASAVETVLEDDFETDLGWTVAAVPYDDPFDPGQQDLTAGRWERADPVPVINPDDDDALTQPGSGFGDNGSFAFVTGPLDGETTGAFDVDWGPVTLRSPVLPVVGGEGRFSYARWFYNDDGDDGLTVEISNDGGATWTLVETVTGRTGWVTIEHPVSEFVELSDAVVFRFSTRDDPNNSITEACVDAFRLVTLFCATADGDDDGDVDLRDFGRLQQCFTGGDGAFPDPQCDVFDFDLDGDVDLIDYELFAAVAGGR